MSDINQKKGEDGESDRIEDIAANYNENNEDYASFEIQKEAQILHDDARLQDQKKYLRKLDLIIMPAISILYFFKHLDRGKSQFKAAGCE